MLSHTEHAWYDSLNIKKQCAEYRVGLWQCPQFLFLIMGVVIITAILVTNIIASKYADPLISALIVLALTVFLLIIGHLIVNAFERVALSVRSKSEFISIVSHHLRSPLSAVKWQLDLVLSDKNPKDQHFSDEIQRSLRLIMDNNERMIRAVNDLLDVNRIEDRDVVLLPHTFSLTALSRNVVDQSALVAKTHSVNIQTEVANNEDVKAYADEERILRVMRHLIDNAVRYSKQNSSITIRIARQGNMARWSVTDAGIGILPQDQPRIFEKFFRGHNSVQQEANGLGVGLFIAKSIVVFSKGKIGYFSAPEKGSTFWFTLPLAP